MLFTSATIMIIEMPNLKMIYNILVIIMVIMMTIIMMFIVRIVTITLKSQNRETNLKTKTPYKKRPKNKRLTKVLKTKKVGQKNIENYIKR